MEKYTTSQQYRMDFANIIGQELWQVLAQRGHEHLGPPSDMDIERFTAYLSAALIPVGEILRDPIARSRDRAAMADKLVSLASERLRALVQTLVEASA